MKRILKLFHHEKQSTVSQWVATGGGLEIQSNNHHEDSLTIDVKRKGILKLDQNRAAQSPAKKVAFLIENKNEQADPVKITVRKNKKSNQVDMNGDKELHPKATAPFFPRMKKKGSKINMQNETSMSQLIKAVKNNDLKMVESLLKQGVDINMLDFMERTVLFLAAKQRQMDMIRLLLKFNIDVTAKDVFGNTAQDIAEEMGHHDCCALIGSHYPQCKNEMNSSPQGQSEEKENSLLAHSSHQEEEPLCGPALCSKEEEPSPDQTFKLLPRMLSEADARAKRIEEEVCQFENGEKRLMVDNIFEVLTCQAAMVHKWLTKLEEYVKETQPNERKLWKEELISSKLHEQTMLNKELQNENASIKALLAQTMQLLSTAQGTVSSCEQVNPHRSCQAEEAARQFLQVSTTNCCRNLEGGDMQTNKPHLEGLNLETDANREQEEEQMQREIQTAKCELQAVLMDMAQLQMDLQGSTKTTRRTHTRNQMSITPLCSVKALLAQTVNHLSAANIHQRQAQATVSRYEHVDPHRSDRAGEAARKLLQVEGMQTNKLQIDGQGDRS